MLQIEYPAVEERLAVLEEKMGIKRIIIDTVPQGMIETVNLTPENKDILRDYWEKLYGPDFANGLLGEG